MKQETFNELVKSRHGMNLNTLCRKGIIYSNKDDKCSNLRDAATFNGLTSAQALWYMVTKHIIATKDMVKSQEVPPQEWVDAYLGDIQCYMYLLEAIWTNERGDSDGN